MGKDGEPSPFFPYSSSQHFENFKTNSSFDISTTFPYFLQPMNINLSVVILVEDLVKKQILQNPTDRI